MIRQIVLWCLAWLEESLDPDLQLRIQAYEQKVAAAEAEEKRVLGEIEASKQKLVLLCQELADNNRKRIELENAILHAKELLQNRIDERADLSDADKVELDL